MANLDRKLFQGLLRRNQPVRDRPPRAGVFTKPVRLNGDEANRGRQGAGEKCGCEFHARSIRRDMRVTIITRFRVSQPCGADSAG